MIEFTMPALGADMDEGRLDEWRVQPGDNVTRGQIVAVVETTKAAVEIECWHEGVVDRLLVPVGETLTTTTTTVEIVTTVSGVAIRPARPHQPSAAELEAHAALLAKLKAPLWLN